MKKIVKPVFMVVLILVLNACTEDISHVPTRFEKIYGKESASTGKSIISLEGGDFLVAGSTMVPGFDFSSAAGILETGNILEMAPSLILADSLGNQKHQRLYPLSSLETHPIVLQLEIAGKGYLVDVKSHSNGRFYAMGEWRVTEMEFDAPWDGLDDVNTNNQVTFPFIITFSSDLEFEQIHSFNLEPDWDMVYHGGSKLKFMDDGNLGILLQMRVRPEYYFPSGYTFILMNEDGIELKRNVYEVNDGYKFARDFDMDNDGKLVFIGQRYKDIVIYRIPLDNMLEEQMFKIDSDGIFGAMFNDNPMYIFALEEGGYMAIYTNPVREVVMHHLDKDFRSLMRKDITAGNSDEYPRAVTRAANGDFLVYNEFLSDKIGNSTTGALYRVRMDGSWVFRLSMDGSPGDVLELDNGDLLVVSNPVYNGVFPKTTVSRISADGTFY